MDKIYEVEGVVLIKRHFKTRVSGYNEANAMQKLRDEIEYDTESSIIDCENQKILVEVNDIFEADSPSSNEICEIDQYKSSYNYEERLLNELAR